MSETYTAHDGKEYAALHAEEANCKHCAFSRNSFAEDCVDVRCYRSDSLAFLTMAGISYGQTNNGAARVKRNVIWVRPVDAVTYALTGELPGGN